MITVVGSLNMDLVTVTDTIPNKGETVLGDRFFTAPGGKGANQAVAAAKLGGAVQMIGCVGDDVFGKEYLTYLHQQGMDTDHITTINHSHTGTASVTIHDRDNTIIVVPGANRHLTPEVVEEHKETIQKSDWLLLQFEIPKESIVKAIDIADQEGVNVILNPAPYLDLPQDCLEKITYLTPNEYEASMVMNRFEQDQKALEVLKEKLVITKGDQGVVFFEGDKEVTVPSVDVDVVDTTGAGDTFNGAFVVALNEGKGLEEACRFAVKAAARSVTKLGAQSGMPLRKELQE